MFKFLAYLKVRYLNVVQQKSRQAKTPLAFYSRWQVQGLTFVFPCLPVVLLQFVCKKIMPS